MFQIVCLNMRRARAKREMIRKREVKTGVFSVIYIIHFCFSLPELLKLAVKVIKTENPLVWVLSCLCSIYNVFKFILNYFVCFQRCLCSLLIAFSYYSVFIFVASIPCSVFIAVTSFSLMHWPWSPGCRSIFHKFFIVLYNFSWSFHLENFLC